jgi:hypothetical protein
MRMNIEEKLQEFSISSGKESKNNLEIRHNNTLLLG